MSAQNYRRVWRSPDAEIRRLINVNKKLEQELASMRAVLEQVHQESRSFKDDLFTLPWPTIQSVKNVLKATGTEGGA